MLILPQTVEVGLISTKIIDAYEKMGYDIPRSLDGRTSRSTKIHVRLEDLPDNSSSIIKIKCDYCGEMSERRYSDYQKSRDNCVVKKDCCRNCQPLKSHEGRFRYTFEDILREFGKANLEVLIDSSKYKEANEAIPYRCLICNHESRVALSNVLLGRGCKKCKQKINSDKQRFSYEFVESYFQEQGCILLSTQYNNKEQILDYICVCGNIGHSRFGCFQIGRRCKVCTSFKMKNSSKKQRVEDIRELFLVNGCTLLSEEYVPNKKLKYVCICGRVDEKVLSKFKDGQRCEMCARDRRSELYRHNLDHVKSVFTQKNCTLISHDYTNSQQMLDYICSCGRSAKSTFANFQKTSACAECFYDRNKGENHPHWNSNITQEERIERRSYVEYYEWVKTIYKRDGYRCQCCDEVGGILNAHHLDGYHWCKERRLDTSNGITLCENCHILDKDSFHKIYGTRNNTEEQFWEWIENKIYKNIEDTKEVSSFFLVKKEAS